MGKTFMRLTCMIIVSLFVFMLQGIAFNENSNKERYVSNVSTSSNELSYNYVDATYENINKSIDEKYVSVSLDAKFDLSSCLPYDQISEEYDMTTMTIALLCNIETGGSLFKVSVLDDEGIEQTDYLEGYILPNGDIVLIIDEGETITLSAGSLTVEQCGWLKKKLKKAVSKVTSTVTKVDDVVEKAADEVKDTAKDVASEVKDTAIDVASEVKDTAKDVASEVKDTAKDVASEVKDTAKDVASEVKDTAKDVASEVKDTAIDVVNTYVPEPVQDAVVEFVTEAILAAADYCLDELELQKTLTFVDKDTALSNYNFNLEQKITDALLSDGYINNQFNFKNWKFGNYNIYEKGCGVVAIYNVLVAYGMINSKNRNETLAKIIYDIECNDGLLLGGILGVYPDAIEAELTSFGISSKTYTNQNNFLTDLSASAVGTKAILLFAYNGNDISEGLHYMMVMKTESGYCTHNAKGSTTYDINSLLESNECLVTGFICTK